MSPLDRFRRNAGRRLRADATDWERKLWRHLWRIPVEGTHFRRQAPIGSYIVDFVSHRLRLIIEVDGEQHGWDAGIRSDAIRDEWLESQGYRVLRFWNDDIRTDMDAVLNTIFAAVDARVISQSFE